MPFSVAAGAVGLASGINSLVNQPGGSASTAIPATFQPPNQATAAGTFLDLANQFSSTSASVPSFTLPGIKGATTALAQNPYASALQGAANVAPGVGQGLLAQDLSGASQLSGAGGQLLNTSFDPQQALYGRTAQQIRDQSNAINSMYGLGSSPAGADLTQQALLNFNIDWQNQQLQRQLQGITGAGRAFAGANDLTTQGLTGFEGAAALPSSTFQGNQNNIIQALNNYAGAVSGAFGPQQQAMNALAAYLKLGQSASSIGQQGGALAFGQQQQNLANILGGLGTLRGGGMNLNNLFGLGGGGTPNPYGSGANPSFGQSPFPNYGFTPSSGGSSYGAALLNAYG